MTTGAVAIVGGGRMGTGLAMALAARGRTVTLLVRSPRDAPVPIAQGDDAWSAAVADAAIVLVATPDGAITDVASRLARMGVVESRHAVLHLSGLLDRSALAPLAGTGAALGSLHPLQTIADPATAALRLQGAYAAVEGDPRAIDVATELARELGMTAVPLPAGGKPWYHLGATFVANYSASLLAIAQRMAERAGIEPAVAGRLYGPLLTGAAANLAAMGPVAALTGAVRRGDVDTIRGHLSRLEGRERRIYCDLGMEALGLARQAGLDEGAADRVQALLTQER